MLYIDNLSFSLEGAQILLGVSFALKKGEYLSVLGPNGAGKSTLLKSILRLHDEGRSGGRITIAGKSPGSCSRKELARMAAYVPQAGGRIPPFTVGDFLLLSRYPHQTGLAAPQRSDEDAVARALALTGMGPFSERKLTSLSGGERQKAFLAAALAQEAPLLLLDEPAAFLDVRHAAEMGALLFRLNREQHLTMVTVTHDVNHPLEAGGKALVLRRGEQLYFGPAEGITEDGILEAAFGHTFTRVLHPQTGKRVLLPDPFPEKAGASVAAKVGMAEGGGHGA